MITERMDLAVIGRDSTWPGGKDFGTPSLNRVRSVLTAKQAYRSLCVSPGGSALEQKSAHPKPVNVNRVARSPLARRRRAEHALVISPGSPADSTDFQSTPNPVSIKIRWLSLVRIFPIILSFVFMPVTCNAAAGPHSIFTTPGSVTIIHPNHNHHFNSSLTTTQPLSATVESRRSVRDQPVQMEISVGFVANLEDSALPLVDYVKDAPGVAPLDHRKSIKRRIDLPPPRFS